MMVEVGMPAFGPGTTTGGGCDFRCSLSSGIMNRMSTEQAMKAQAADLATAKSELGDVDPIGIYRLFVGETTYKNKVTGDIVTETTLLSPTSNNEGPGVWTDAGEHGTGTKEEYQAILGRARELANTEGAATMFWASPAKEKRGDGMPEHRAYLWKKNAKGEVTAYAYQLTGSIDALSKTFSRLSTNASLFDPQSLLWKSSDDTISHKKIFDAYESSLTAEEREGTKDFLERFREETTQSDSVLFDRIERYKEQYEQQLQEVYTGDIESAIKVLASGFIALARDNGAEETTVGVQQENVPDITIPITLAILAAYDRQKKEEESKSIRSLHTTQKEKRKGNSFLELFDEKKRIKELSSDEKGVIEIVIQEEMIEPVVPALITLLYLIPHGRVGEGEGEGGESDYSDEEILPLETRIPQEESTEVWRSFIALLLAPEEQTGEESLLQYTEMTSEEEIHLFFPESDLLSNESGGGREDIHECVESVFTELSFVLTCREENEEHIPQEVETEVVDVVQEIFTLLSGGKNLEEEKANEKKNVQTEPEMYLSLFLSLYAEKGTSPEMKELLTLFLYEEIKTLGKEHISTLSQNEKYLIFIKEMALYEPLFEKKKALVSEKLWQLLAREIENSNYIDPKSREKIETLLFLLYALHKNEPEKISSLIVVVERLKKSVCSKGRENTMDSYLFALERLLVNKQRKKKAGNQAGIIYWFWFSEYYRFVGLSLLVVNQI